MFIVTDRNDKDRRDFIIDTFDTRKDAEHFAAEWSTEWGTCEIESCSVIAHVWGDGQCLELDRFNPDPGPDDSFKETTEYIEWWNDADEPWICTVECPDKASQQDLVRTCDLVIQVKSYSFATGTSSND